MKVIIETADIRPGGMFTTPDKQVVMIQSMQVSGMFAISNFTKAALVWLNLNAAQVAEKLTDWGAKPLWLDEAQKAEDLKREID